MTNQVIIIKGHCHEFSITNGSTPLMKETG